MTSHPFTRLLAVALCGGMASLALAAELPEVANSTVYELPKFTVTNPLELPAPEAWRYTRIPGFEVLSNASDGATQRFLREFQVMQQVLDITWPVLRRASAPLPTTLILTTRGKAADSFLYPRGRLMSSGDAFEFQEFDASDPTQTRGGLNHVASRFYASEEQACIVVNLADEGTGNADPYRQFYEQYLRYLMSRFEAPSPPWLVEGIASLFAGIDYSDKWIEFGQLGGRKDDFNQLLTPKPAETPAGDPDDSASQTQRDDAVPGPLKSGVGAVPALDAMLSATEEQLRADPKLRMFARGFVHLCLYGRGLKYQKPLFVYLGRVKGGAGTQQVFRECFGMSYAQMRDELVGYAAFTDYRHIQFNAQKGQGLTRPEAATLRAATPAEIGRIKGEGLILAGNRDAALLELLAPYVRGQQDNDLLAALALAELQSENRTRVARGRRLLEIATTGGTTRARAYLEIARLRYTEAVGPLEGARREQVLELLRKAAALPPAQEAVYELLADVWSNAADQPPAADVLLLERGAARFPGRLGLVYRTAQLCAANGRVAQAAGMAAWGEKMAAEPRDRQRFAELRASLPPLPATRK